MSLRTAILGFAVLAAVVSASPAAAAEKWLKAETRHFTIYSAGNREQLAKFAVQLEKFDALLRLLTRAPGDEQPLRLPVYVLATADSVASLAGDRGGTIAGFYRPDKYGSFAVANRERGNSRFDLRGDTVLQHEYAHHFMFRNFAFAYPAWYVEGFAEFVATAEFEDDGSWNAGKVPGYRAYGLVMGADLPIERMLFGTTAGLTRAQVETFYGRSWLLVHMLRNDKAREGQLEVYLKAIGNGVADREAAKAFGDLAELDKQLDRYLVQKRLNYVMGKGPLAFAPEVKLAELDPIDSRLIALTVKRKAATAPRKTRDQLAALAAEAPGRAPVWLELALAEQGVAEAEEAPETKRAGLAGAEAAADKAIAADPKLGRAHLLKAQLLMDRLDGENQRSAVAWKPVRDHIGKANRADTEDPAPLFTWYEALVRQGIGPDQLASDGLAKAFYLQPEATDLRVQYAFDLARQKRFDEAIRTIEFVVRNPHDAERGNELLARLREMRNKAGEEDESDASR